MKDIVVIDNISYDFWNEIYNIEPTTNVDLLEQASNSNLEYVGVISLIPFKGENKSLFSKKVVVDKDTSGKLYYTILEGLSENELNLLRDANLEWDTNEYFILKKKSEQVMDYTTDNNMTGLAPIYDALGVSPRTVIVEENTMGEEDCMCNSIKDETLDKTIVNDLLPLLTDDQKLEVIDFMELLIEGNQILLIDSISHISAKQQVANRIRRKDPRVAASLRKRRKRSAMCPTGMAWSSKTNSCRMKDPKRQISAKRASMVRLRG